METFGTALKRLRDEAGKSQEQLAADAGVSRDAIYLLESEQRDPSFETVRKLAMALGTNCLAFQDTALRQKKKSPPSKRRCS